MNNSQSQRKYLLGGKISELVIKMAVPPVVIRLINLVYNTVDTYFISSSGHFLLAEHLLTTNYPHG